MYQIITRFITLVGWSRTGIWRQERKRTRSTGRHQEQAKYGTCLWTCGGEDNGGLCSREDDEVRAADSRPPGMDEVVVRVQKCRSPAGPRDSRECQTVDGVWPCGSGMQGARSPRSGRWRLTDADGVQYRLSGFAVGRLGCRRPVESRVCDFASRVTRVSYCATVAQGMGIRWNLDQDWAVKPYNRAIYITCAMGPHVSAGVADLWVRA